MKEKIYNKLDGKGSFDFIYEMIEEAKKNNKKEEYFKSLI